MIRKRLLSAACALCLICSLVSTALAETYSVTLSAAEASSDIPVALSIPAQTPAGVGEEANRIVITAPTAHAAVEITVSGKASDADVFFLNSDGTYTVAEDTVTGSGTLCTMLPEKSATLIILKKMPFVDAARSSWYYNSVAYVYHNGLMNGTGDGTKFSPNDKVSRAMIATILWRQAGKPALQGSASFSDVPNSQYYTEAALWCAEQGIMTGSNNKFSPNGEITREQLAIVMYRYCKAMGYNVNASASLSSYVDSDKVSSSAKDAMSWAVAEGLITGTDKNELNPSGSVTRSVLATILMRYFGNK